MANDLNKLLMFIISNRIMQDESREAQLDATAVQDVPQEIRAIAEDHRQDAQRLAPYFERGLRMAAANNGSLTVDDTDPDGNLIADAFARYLVAPNLATSESVPLSSAHYRYTFTVDWPQLRQVARRAGVDLDSALMPR